MPPGSMSLGPVAGIFSGAGAEVGTGVEVGAGDDDGAGVAGCALFDGAGVFEFDGAGALLDDVEAVGAFVFTTSGLPLRCCKRYMPPMTSATRTIPTTTKDTTDPPWLVRV